MVPIVQILQRSKFTLTSTDMLIVKIMTIARDLTLPYSIKCLWDFREEKTDRLVFIILTIQLTVCYICYLPGYKPQPNHRSIQPTYYLCDDAPLHPSDVLNDDILNGMNSIKGK